VALGRPARRGMPLVAGTSAESKKTVAKCNVTHRFGGPRRARKKLSFSAFQQGSGRVCDCDEGRALIVARNVDARVRVWCGERK